MRRSLTRRWSFKIHQSTKIPFGCLGCRHATGDKKALEISGLSRRRTEHIPPFAVHTDDGQDVRAGGLAGFLMPLAPCWPSVAVHADDGQDVRAGGLADLLMPLATCWPPFAMHADDGQDCVR